MSNTDFIPHGSPPLDKFNLSKPITVGLKRFEKEGGLFTPRHFDESWSKYIIREEAAIEAFKKAAIGKLLDKQYRLSLSSDADLNYTQFRYSEFRIVGYSGEIVFSLDGDREATCSASYISSCINTNEILSMFDFEANIQTRMRNIENYISHHMDLNHNVYVSAWLARTGMPGRTAALENTIPGEELSIIKRDNHDLIINQHKQVIGDLELGSDTCPSTENPNEFREVYRPLERQGNLQLSSITLKQVIEHGSPNGRKRKALGEVLIEYKVVQPISVNKVADNYFQNCARKIRALAYIDYNRKYDILTRRISGHVTCLEDVLSPVNISENSEYTFITKQSIRSFCLDNINLSVAELSTFWNIYLPLHLYINRINSESCHEFDVLHTDMKYSKLSGTLLFEGEFIQVQNSRGFWSKDVLLSIYRKTD